MKRELLVSAILDVLNEISAPIPERTIVLTMNTLLRLSPTYTDLRQGLKSMEERRLVAGISSSTDGTIVWSITAEGRLHIAELQSGEH